MLRILQDLLHQCPLGDVAQARLRQSHTRPVGNFELCQVMYIQIGLSVYGHVSTLGILGMVPAASFTGPALHFLYQHRPQGP